MWLLFVRCFVSFFFCNWLIKHDNSLVSLFAKCLHSYLISLIYVLILVHKSCLTSAPLVTNAEPLPAAVCTHRRGLPWYRSGILFLMYPRIALVSPSSMQQRRTKQKTPCKTSSAQSGTFLVRLLLSGEPFHCSSCFFLSWCEWCPLQSSRNNLLVTFRLYAQYGAAAVFTTKQPVWAVICAAMQEEEELHGNYAKRWLNNLFLKITS